MVDWGGQTSEPSNDFGMTGFVHDRIRAEVEASVVDSTRVEYVVLSKTGTRYVKGASLERTALR